MQTQFVGIDIPAPGARQPPPRRYAWDEEEKAASGEDADLFGVPDVPLTIYRSGASAKWDFLGYRYARSPVGITATELPSRVVPYVVQYLDDHGEVFVDSGAFGRFRQGQSLDFETEVFPLYEELLAATTRPQGLLLVAPDIVGAQAESLALQTAHAERLRRWCETGASVIFPIQEGHANPVAAYTAIAKLLGNLPFVVGIPSNAKAWSADDLVRFVKAVRPSRIHLLGLSATVKARQWALKVQCASPETQVTCDACQIIAHAGQGRRLTDRCQSRMDAVLSQAADTGSPVGVEEADALPDVETFRHCLYDSPHLLTAALARDLAIALDAPEWGSRFEAAVPNGFQEVFAQLDPDETWLQERLIDVVPQLYADWLRVVLAGPIRAHEVGRLADE